MSLRSLKNNDDLKTAFRLFKDEFSDRATEADFLNTIQQMFNEGCELFGWENNHEIVSAVCVAVRTDFANGKHLYVYEMATDGSLRSKGFGKQLMTAVEAWARQQGCLKVILYSGLQREGAHRFWIRHMGYEHRGSVFKKPLLGFASKPKAD